VRVEFGAFGLTLAIRLERPFPAPIAMPGSCRREADRKPAGRSPCRQASFDRFDHPLAKVYPVSSRHEFVSLSFANRESRPFARSQTSDSELAQTALVSLLDAREKRDDAKRLLVAGINPSTKRKEEKATAITEARTTIGLERQAINLQHSQRP